MVSLRCKMVVKAELEKLGLHYTTVDLGMVEIMEDINEPQRERLRAQLLQSGLELMDNKRAILIEKIKNVIIEIAYKLNYSSVSHLSNQFKKVTGLSPFFFKQLKQKRMNNLENL